MTKKTFYIISSFYALIISALAFLSAADTNYMIYFNFLSGYIEKTSWFKTEPGSYIGFPFFLSILTSGILWKPIYNISSKLDIPKSVVIAWVILFFT